LRDPRPSAPPDGILYDLAVPFGAKASCSVFVRVNSAIHRTQRRLLGAAYDRLSGPFRMEGEDRIGRGHAFVRSRRPRGFIFVDDSRVLGWKVDCNSDTECEGEEGSPCLSIPPEKAERAVRVPSWWSQRATAAVSPAMKAGATGGGAPPLAPSLPAISEEADGWSEAETIDALRE
ncbi:hypothetical protein FOZ62_015775, partial [Perkinsus olseni]